MTQHDSFLASLQLELAMALSSTLDLKDMLNRVLVIMLRRLDGAQAAAYCGASDVGSRSLVVVLPRNASVEASIDAGLHGVMKLERDGPPRWRHVFDLPGFGALVFDRSAAPLDEVVRHALEPLMQGLGRTARAYADHAALASSDQRFAERLKSLRDVIFQCEIATDGSLTFQYVSPR